MSPLIHALVALAFFLPFAILGNPVAGAAAGAFYFFGREGLDAQISAGRSKSSVPFLPFKPWRWPRQSIVDSVFPAVAVTIAAVIWLAASEGSR